MKLIYLWIESYKCIEKQGYLLNANYDVKFDKKKNELSVSPKESLDSMLYGDNISVTAIVGDNGAGKSTLLDAIRIVLFDDLKRGTEISGFLIWENEGDLQLFPFMEDNQLPEIKQPSILKKENVIDDIPDNSDLIYYSDFLDEKYYSKTFDNDINVNEIRNSINLPICFQDRSSAQVNISTAYLLKKRTDEAFKFFHDDTKRQIDYYGSLQEKKCKLPFDVPKSLSVEIEFLNVYFLDDVFAIKIQPNYEENDINEIITKSYVKALFEQMKEIFDSVIYNKKILNSAQILQWDIFIAYIYNRLGKRKNGYEDPDDYYQIDEEIKKLISVEIEELKTNMDIFWEKLDIIFSKDTTEDNNFKEYLKFYQKTWEMLSNPKDGNFYVDFSVPELLESFLRSARHPIPTQKTPADASVPTRHESAEEYSPNKAFKDILNHSGWRGSIDLEQFKEFFNIYINVAPKYDFMTFSWGMSSGESNMFSIFARMYDALKRCSKKSIILLFDELDSSFHPKWQQKIIGSLTQFLRVNYPEKKFQVILTTHSPVLLSDIPRENVIFMRKDCNVETEHNQTFAANIASLYYDSFFMEKGSIGEVARNSIVNLLTTISNREKKDTKVDCLKLLELFLKKQYQVKKNKSLKNIKSYKEEDARRYLQLLIDNIGEDIWRYKVNEQFHLLLEKNKTNEEIEEELREKLKEVEKSKGKDYVKNILKSLLEEEDQ